MTRPDPGAEDHPLVLDFVLDFEEDRAAGGARPLAHYLARYPEAELAIAQEYLRLAGRRPGEPARETAADSDPLARYELLAPLGSGGQGRVFLARDTKLGRQVALKLLESHHVTPLRRQRLQREAAAIARIDHPGIAEVLDADFAGAQPFLAMRYVPGIDLASALRRRGTEPTAQLELVPTSASGVRALVRYFAGAARALHAAHEAGIVHRDVKPGNLMVRPDGQPVVLDFGLAAMGDQDALTRVGESMGTPEYMAPEQVTGGRVDRRTDVYGLGVALYECLTGGRPFRAATGLALEQAIVLGRATPPSRSNRAVPRDLEIVLATAMEADPRRRYPTALELAEDLQRCDDRRPIRARPVGILERARRFAVREPALATTLGVLLATLSSGLALAIAGIRERDRLIDDKDEALTSKEVALAGERSALEYAYSRLYVERAEDLSLRDPAAALAFGSEAVARRSDVVTRSALFAPLAASRLERRLDAEGARRVSSAHFSPDGARLVASSEIGEVWVWSIVDAEPPLRVQAPSDEAVAVSFAPDGASLVATTHEGASANWTASTNTWVPLATDAPASLDSADMGCTVEAGAGVLSVSVGGRTFELPGQAPFAVAWSSDASRLAVAAAPGVLRVLDVLRGEVTLEQSSDFLPERVEWSADGTRLLVETRSASVFVWRAGSIPELDSLPPVGCAVRGAWFLPDDTGYVVLYADGSWRVRRRRGHELVGSLGVAVVRALRASAAPRALVEDEAGELSLLDLDPTAGLVRTARRSTPGARVATCALAPSGADVVVVDTDGEATLWSAATDTCTRLGGGVGAAEFTRDGASVLLGRATGEVVVQGLAGDPAGTPRVLPRPFEGDAPRAVRALAPSPDGTQVAVGYDPTFVVILDLATGAASGAPIVVSRFERLAWTTPARILVTRPESAGSTRTIELTTRRPSPVRLPRDAGVAWCAPLGEELVLACRDGRARVLGPDSAVVLEFPLHVRGRPGVALTALDVAETAFGPAALTGDEAGGVHLWPLDPVTVAARRAGRAVDPWERLSIEFQVEEAPPR